MAYEPSDSAFPIEEPRPQDVKAGVPAPLLSIVVPCFNEAEALPFFFERVNAALRRLEVTYEIVCVNDGSTDDTLARLVELQNVCAQLIIVDLSRNFGKEAALTASVRFATGQAVIPMDCDLQDPPELIEDMLRKWREGFDVVLARRVDRATDSSFKRITARWFYRLHNWLSNTPLPEDVGDFRLMDRRVVEALNALPERRRFMKGLFSWVGFRTTTVDYSRSARVAGKSKFDAWRLWNFAIEGITGFSTVPLRVWTYFGALVSVLSFAYGTFLILRTLLLGVDVPGYASTLTAILLLGGIQLVGIGVLGEYVGRIYHETKGRPLYIVREIHRKIP